MSNTRPRCTRTIITAPTAKKRHHQHHQKRTRINSSVYIYWWRLLSPSDNRRRNARVHRQSNVIRRNFRTGQCTIYIKRTSELPQLVTKSQPHRGANIQNICSVSRDIYLFLPVFLFFSPLIIRSLCFIRSTSYSPYLWYLLPTTSLSCELELNTSSHRYLSVNLQRQCDGVKITTVSFFFATVNLRWQRMDFIWIGLISICSKRISASVQGYIEIENRSCRERIEMSNIYFTECPSIAIFFFAFFQGSKCQNLFLFYCWRTMCN